MKTTITLVLFGLFISLSGQAQQQKEPKDSERKNTASSKQMNLLDEQVKVLNSVFELGNPVENPLEGNTTYIGLLESTEIEPELKKELREQYQIYDLSLDPKKKDSLKIVFAEKLRKALEKSQSEIKQ